MITPKCPMHRWH